jgi:calcium/calmodulin-dependent protein kinase kinase 2
VRGHLVAGSFNIPLSRHSASDFHNDEEQGNPLYLIREEIAIMKKLDHPNLVSLIEVLDDPEEDSLYMVLEMCKKGVIMKVGLGERAEPYDIESCRCWFRDLILGIEYRKFSFSLTLAIGANSFSTCPGRLTPRYQA